MMKIVNYFKDKIQNLLDTYERTDMDPTLLDKSSVSTKINEKMMSYSKRPAI